MDNETGPSTLFTNLKTLEIEDPTLTVSPSSPCLAMEKEGKFCLTLLIYFDSLHQ